MNSLATLLNETIGRELPHLRALSEEQSSVPRAKAGAWTPKQELGHLVDSAANNHMRFVLAALERHYEGPAYAQNDWVALHAYHALPWTTIVDFWYFRNLQLVYLFEQIPVDVLGSLCVINAAPPVELSFLIQDYVVHLQHHIDQLLLREHVTPYPAATTGV